MNAVAETKPFYIELPPSLVRAIQRLDTLGGKCYIVGGSVRDALLGLEPKDFDVEVYGLELSQIESQLAKLGKTDLVGKSFAVVKLWTHGEEYDFAIPRRESKTGAGHRSFDVQADASMKERDAIQRRDFTINALLYDPANKQIIDYCGGIQDLESRTLRHVGPAFVEDPLRVLRAVQFAGRFGMTLAPDTATLCQSMDHEFWDLAKERIWLEWEKWSNRSTSLSSGMKALLECGWLKFFPELHALVNLPQDPAWHPEGSVWIHTLCCLDALQAHTDWDTLDADSKSVLSLAVLCHDLGKTRCTRYALKRGEKHWISPGHDKVSSWLSAQFLGRFRAPNRIVEKVSALVSEHHFLVSGFIGAPSESSIRRLAKRLAPATAHELTYVLISDHRGRPPLFSEEQDTRIQNFKAQIAELAVDERPPEPIVKGRHLISRGLPPGIHFKAHLDAAYEAQLSGAFNTSEEGEAWLDNYLSQNTP